jgi:hypothetical protein
MKRETTAKIIILMLCNQFARNIFLSIIYFKGFLWNKNTLSIRIIS